MFLLSVPVFILRQDSWRSQNFRKPLLKKRRVFSRKTFWHFSSMKRLIFIFVIFHDLALLFFYTFLSFLIKISRLTAFAERPCFLKKLEIELTKWKRLIRHLGFLSLFNFQLWIFRKIKSPKIQQKTLKTSKSSNSRSFSKLLGILFEAISFKSWYLIFYCYIVL